MILSETPDLLTVEEVAKLLRVFRATAYKLVHGGELRAIKVGRQWRVPRAAVVAYLSGGK